MQGSLRGTKAPAVCSWRQVELFSRTCLGSQSCDLEEGVATASLVLWSWLWGHRWFVPLSSLVCGKWSLSYGKHLSPSSSFFSGLDLLVWKLPDTA